MKQAGWKRKILCNITCKIKNNTTEEVVGVQIKDMGLTDTGTICKIDKQQGYTIWHGELYPLSLNTL